MKEDKDCCEIWSRIATRFDWMFYADHPEMATMPHINGHGGKYFVNFCPSCGKDARNRNMLGERLPTKRAADAIEPRR